jgi:hypothetical protein
MSYSYDLNSMNLSDDTLDTFSISSNGAGFPAQVFSVTGNVIGAATGQVYTTNNTSGSGLYWGLNGTSGITLTEPSISGASLQVKGDANFEGEVTIKGKSLTDMFEKIEERLAILHPNPELEDKWDELKELGKRYKELEAKIIEKENMWKILKK